MRYLENVSKKFPITIGIMEKSSLFKNVLSENTIKKYLLEFLLFEIFKLRLPKKHQLRFCLPICKIISIFIFWEALFIM
jgi:hypothetical protein